MKPQTDTFLHSIMLRDKPLFGMDIGHDTLRVMQFESTAKGTPRVKGYGSVYFSSTAIRDGVIVHPETVAKAAYRLFSKKLTGDISTRRVAISLPVSRALTRAVQLPIMKPKEIAEAVRTDAEQYLPAAIDSLYLDYTILNKTADTIEVFVVAVPRTLVDSYTVLAQMLGLEVILFDTTIGASARLFAKDKLSDIPTVLVDFGANSTDITIVHGEPVVTGTVAYGGDDITSTIMRTLDMSERQATTLKSRYGLSVGPYQKQFTSAVTPSLETLIKEIKRTIRYYEQRYANEAAIDQVVTMGGGANMPGLAERLTEQLRLPVRPLDLTSLIGFGKLSPLAAADHMSYVTAAGLALAPPTELFS